MIATKREIKKAFADLQKVEHEMTLIDYASSNEEASIHERIVQLNSMSLNFMLNDSQITVNIVITERIENVASNVAADNDRSMFHE
jgi:aryl-alcohol dehydrogenase-like predicted oxidoreductase